MNSDCYNITYKGVKLDPYRILKEYGITHPAQAHAIKKLLRCGKSHKDLPPDIQECIDTLVRWRQMIEEDTLHPCRMSVDDPFNCKKYGYPLVVTGPFASCSNPSCKG